MKRKKQDYFNMLDLLYKTLGRVQIFKNTFTAEFDIKFTLIKLEILTLYIFKN